MKAAIVGAPFAGKTALFTAVTGVEADPGKYHGAKPQPGQVPVPDPRLDEMAAHYDPKKTTPVSLEFLDFAGLELGSGTEHTKALLAAVREADVLVTVLQGFGNPTKTPAETWEALRTEFLFSDLEQIEKRLLKLEGSLKRPVKNKDADLKEKALLEGLKAHLESTESFDGFDMDDAQEKSLRGFRFLTQRPVIPVLNVEELQPVPEGLPADTLVLNASVESDVAQLTDDAERQEFLDEYGITEPAGPRLIREAFARTGSCVFFTVGPDECRAWEIPCGIDVVSAAGKIHTDLARGFIRAEVFAYTDWVEHGDEKGLKAAGKLRVEGKEYIVKDGDVLNIRFSV